MVEIKALASPKVAIPIVGIVVLVVVSTLVAVFYVRNPTVTDNIFGGGNAENSTESSGDSDHVTQSAMGSSGHLLQSTTPGNHEQSTPAATTTPAVPVTLPATPSPVDSPTPMHAIEPVQHL